MLVFVQTSLNNAWLPLLIWKNFDFSPISIPLATPKSRLYKPSGILISFLICLLDCYSVVTWVNGKTWHNLLQINSKQNASN